MVVISEGSAEVLAAHSILNRNFTGGYGVIRLETVSWDWIYELNFRDRLEAGCKAAL